MEPGPTVNAVGRMLGLLGDEWTLLIAQQALLGATRYGEFAARLPISNAALTSRLASMTSEGLLDRAGRDYRLTSSGRSLWPMLVSIWEWERRWVPEHALPAMWHSGCDAECAPSLTCGDCGAATTEKTLDARWGPSGSWARSMPTVATRRRSQGDRAGLFPQTMTILGNRWSFAVMVAAFVGTSRFTDFAAQLGAPPGSLSDRLQILVANDVLTTTDGRYRLTEKGRAVLPILVTALDWAQRWLATPEGPAVELTHTTCGAAFHAVLACDQCGEDLHGRSVGIVPTA
jgi:DNA-binding HxlR family transcriptional regulator